MNVLGIDIGGSGIKGAPVDTNTGELLAPRYRIPTPEEAAPKDVAAIVAKITQHFDWQGPIGCGIPSVVQGGITRTAANIHKDWIGLNAQFLLSEATACPVWACNDADAAGLAEMRFGAGKDRAGVVLIVTVGTGIGTALFTNGHLVPNTELGHIEIKGKDAESRASDAARKNNDWSWKAWAKRFNQYLLAIEHLFWPDLFIIGGGVSKRLDKFADRLTISTELVPAKLLNDAGIVGAGVAVEVAQQTNTLIT